MIRRHSGFSGRNSVLVCLSLALGWVPDVFLFSTEALVTHRARSLQPGEVVCMTVNSPIPLKGLQARVFERTFLFYPQQGPKSWQGLIGVDLDVKPGKHAVELLGRTSQEKPISFDYSLLISPKAFPTRRLTVDPKFVTPPQQELERIQKEARLVQEIIARTTPDRLWRDRFILPVPGAPVSGFGRRSILNGQPRSPHAGTDFSGAVGTPIKSPSGGRVVLAADLYYSGNTVILDHGLGLYSYFAHLSRIFVQEGDIVQPGTLIGDVGATGRVTGPHLHWSIRLAESRVDPLSLIEVLQPIASRSKNKKHKIAN